MVAALLLMCPIETGFEQQLCYVRPSLLKICLDNELLDHREKQSFLAKDKDFRQDLLCLRIRYQELNGSPAGHDAMRLPEYELINDMLHFNRAYRKYLIGLLEFHEVDDDSIREAIKETDLCYKIWDSAGDARSKYYYVTMQRKAMKNLKKLIGDDAWNDGVLPPHVPVWRFGRLYP
jgi:hypothetical protein